MKLFLVALLVAYASADVAHILGKEAQAQILKQDQDVGLEGQYEWSFETENGISARAQGALQNPQAENPAQIVQGESTYTAPDGQVVRTQYTADENGYVAVGSHIPTSPPIPEEILRSLEFIRLNAPAQNFEGKPQN